jgi:hypothetical protein
LRLDPIRKRRIRVFWVGRHLTGQKDPTVRLDRV